MRICILTTSFPRYSGDYAGCFIYDLVKRLSQKGFSITVLAPSDVQAKQREQREGVQIIRFDYFLHRAWQRLTYHLGMPYNLKKSILAKLQLPIFMLVYSYKSILLARKNDIIWSHWLLPSGLIGALCARVLKKKHIVTVHSNGTLAFGRYSLVNILVRFVINNSEEVIVVSPFIKKEFLEVLPFSLREKIAQRVHCIPMGIDRNLFRNKTKREHLRRKYHIDTKYVILFLGRLVECKGLRFLLKAVQGLDDYTLIIAGRGEAEKTLEKKAHALGSNIRWIGLISGNEKLDYLHLADLLVVPSITHTAGIAEGLPVVILEAFACGKPVIGTCCGGIQDVIRNGYNGFLVPPKSTQAIYHRLRLLFNNESLLTQMGRNAFSFSRQFELNLIVQRYQTLLN